MSKTPRLPSTQLHGELQGVWLLSTPTLQLSRVYLPSTCDITHVITYTRPSSLLFYFWVRGRGRPGDEATLRAHKMETGSPQGRVEGPAKLCSVCVYYSQAILKANGSAHPHKTSQYRNLWSRAPGFNLTYG